MNADSTSSADALHDAITDVPGIEVGHFTDARRPTGCTVVLTRAGAVAAVDVRGAAPGTRETDLLDPSNLVDRVHAVLLSGGSSFGLQAAAGVVDWLEAQGIGFAIGPHRIPIVPAAILFDLFTGDGRIRPDAAAGRAACEVATAMPPAQGSVGAGTGASVGKLFGVDHAMKGGIGTASLRVAGVTVGAIVAVNAVGDVVDPANGSLVAGAREPGSLRLRGTTRSLLAGTGVRLGQAGAATTIGVVACDAVLDKAQARKIAQMAHDGLARTIDPVHTLYDGDTLFALATGRRPAPADPMLLGVAAAQVTARAVLNAVRHASRVTGPGVPELPTVSDLREASQRVCAQENRA